MAPPTQFEPTFHGWSRELTPDDPSNRRYHDFGTDYPDITQMESQAPPGRLLDPDYHAIGIEVHFTPGVTAIFLLRERIGAGFSGYEDAVYADKAYDDKGRIEHLKAQGIMPGILKSARRNTPLTEWERTWNRYLSTLRSPVERVFGTLKRSYGFRRGRYTGLERTWNQALLLCMAFNLRKMIKLLPAS